MTKYFLNIRQSGRSDDMEGYINYKFDLEIPLIFSIFSEEKKEYRQLEIKTNKSKDEFFRSSDTDKWGTIERYWNLCVPEIKLRKPRKK